MKTKNMTMNNMIIRRLQYLLFVFLFTSCIGKNKEIFGLNVDTDTTTQGKLILTQDSVFITKDVGLATTRQSKLILTQDSGFITKDVGLAFLLFDSLTHNLHLDLETTPDNIYWQNFNPTDTIGKYYKMENNNYIMCLIDPAALSEDFAENHIIIKINSNGELLKSETFSHHYNYRCWGNAYEGFSKYGDFFGLKICGDGAGWTYTHLCLFKEVIPQDSIPPILFRGNFYIWGDIPFYLNYHIISMKINKNELLIHYNYERTEKRKTDEGNIEIKYFYENGKWDTKDKKKLEEKLYF